MGLCWLPPCTSPYHYMFQSRCLMTSFHCSFLLSWNGCNVWIMNNGWFYLYTVTNDDKGYTGILISLLILDFESRILLIYKLPINEIWKTVSSSYLLYKFLVNAYLCIQNCHRWISYASNFLEQKMILRLTNITAGWWWVSCWSCLLLVEWTFVFFFDGSLPFNFHYHL